MLMKAFEKYKESDEGKKKIKTIFKVLDAESTSFPDNYFDTIVDTFGLCSFINPDLVLSELKRIAKPDAKLLFLEHGRRASDGFLNTLLDKSAQDHFCRWGCWWNRDIVGILERNKMVIMAEKKYHFGTSHSIVCKNVKEV